MSRRLALAGAAAAALVSAAVLAAPMAVSVTTRPGTPAVVAAPQGPRPEAAPGELAHVAAMVGAPDAWRAGYDGTGVGIALIDSGVTPVAGLDSGAVIPGPDFTAEGLSDATRNLDGAGHGTHLAGIMVGRPTAGAGAVGDFTGVAPGAHVVSIKVADRAQATDADDVVAALRWTIDHATDPGLDIRVVNLSFDLSPADAASPALRSALADAHRAGLVVVAAAGNDAGTTLRSPAADPGVIAVSASDPAGTVPVDDDVVADFATRGDDARRPDLLAPGRSVLSLLAPASVAGAQNPASVVDGRLIKGSGTSQAAAVVSGAVALLLDERPDLTPDQVRRVLTTAARPLAGTGPEAGAGLLDLAAARRVAAATPVPAAASAGTSLRPEASSATRPAVAWSSVNWSSVNWSSVNWSSVNWSSVNWSSVNWSSVNWSSVNWSSVNWSSVNWSSVNWSSVNWSSVNWSSVNWSSVNWSSVNWSSVNWSSVNWSSVNWSSVNWS